jgi:hypothetical protein
VAIATIYDTIHIGKKRVKSKTIHICPQFGRHGSQGFKNAHNAGYGILVLVVVGPMSWIEIPCIVEPSGFASTLLVREPVILGFVFRLFAITANSQ